ncbi:MAG: hemerythrin domain-containing protein [Acidobacteriota bacterium]
MNALELLKADHQKVADLFEKAESAKPAEQHSLFEKINTELEIHAHIEETIFYPKLREEGNEELQDIVKEGIEEHHQVKIFLRELSALTEDSEKFEPKFTVLKEDVEHHVKEEEDEMFPLVKAQFDASVLEKLGSEMEAEKVAFGRTLSASAGK